jgi:hypothetical protein
MKVYVVDTPAPPKRHSDSSVPVRADRTLLELVSECPLDGPPLVIPASPGRPSGARAGIQNLDPGSESGVTVPLPQIG